MQQNQIVIHIGYPKAGSTSLQHNLFFDNPRINYLSSNKPKEAGNEFQNHPDTLYFYRHLFEKNIAYREDVSADIWNQHFAPVLSLEKVNVLSAEHFLKNAVPVDVVARRLFAVIPNGKILIIIRNQIDLLRSYYDMFPFAMWDGSTKYLPLQKWLEKIFEEQTRNLAGALFYPSVIDLYATLFGRQQVGVYLFEDLFRGGEATAGDDLAEFLGLEGEDTKERLARRGANVASQHFWSKMARRVLGDFHASDVLPLWMIRKLERIGSYMAPSRRTKIGQAQATQISSFYQESNAELAKALGRDLSALGY
jgi:hypothetical protein